MIYHAIENTGNLACVWRSREPVWKATYWRMPTLWHSGKSKTVQTVKRPGVWAERMTNRQSSKDFLGQQKYSVWHYTVDTCHYTLVQPMECEHQEWALGKPWASGDDDVRCSFLRFNRRTTQWPRAVDRSDSEGGEGSECMGTLYLLLKVLVDLKLLWKTAY